MSTQTLAYRNPGLSVEARVADLLGRMTLAEKVGQFIMWDARPDDLSFINTRQPGSILHTLGEKVKRAIGLAAQNRLGIPLLVGQDAIHGHSFWKGATIFPAQITMACSWNPDLLEQVGRVTAAEVVPPDIHWTFSRVLWLTRALCWGRTNATLGEDPFVVVLLNSKLLVLPASAKRGAALVERFNPGREGGRALAEALFGLLHPSGKLTISIPAHVGQQPVFYSQGRGQTFVASPYLTLTLTPTPTPGRRVRVGVKGYVSQTILRKAHP